MQASTGPRAAMPVQPSPRPLEPPAMPDADEPVRRQEPAVGTPWVHWLIRDGVIHLLPPNPCADTELLEAACGIVSCDDFRHSRGALIDISAGCRRIKDPWTRPLLRAHLMGARVQLGETPIAVLVPPVMPDRELAHLRRLMASHSSVVTLTSDRSRAMAWLQLRSAAAPASPASHRAAG